MRMSSKAHYQTQLQETVGPAGEIFHNYGVLRFFYYMTLTGLKRVLCLFLLPIIGVQEHIEVK